MDDSHVFKWVDEAFTNEIQQLKYQVRMLDEEVQVLKEKIRSEGPKNRKIMILGGYLIPIIAVALGIWMYE